MIVETRCKDRFPSSCFAVMNLNEGLSFMIGWRGADRSNSEMVLVGGCGSQRVPPLQSVCGSAEF
jgi:hypothetical protein